MDATFVQKNKTTNIIIIFIYKKNPIGFGGSLYKFINLFSCIVIIVIIALKVILN